MMPRTVEEFAALPEGGRFGITTYSVTDDDRARGHAEINGARVDVQDRVRSIQVPVPPQVVAYFDYGGLHGFCDDAGVEWKLGRYADGRWFRQRA